MTSDPPILNYSKPARSAGTANGLRIIGAVVCAITGLGGVGLLLLGVVGLIKTALREMPEIDRQGDLGAAAVISVIGLVMLGFSVRWFLDAVRAVRRAGSEVAPATAGSPGAADKSGR